MTKVKIFLIAGEPSGDRLGASLMAGLKSLNPKIEFYGIGGPLMTAQGLNSLFPMAELSVMGLVEVLPKLPGLLARVRHCATAVTNLRPDALITIDSPDFCLRVAKKVKAANPAQKTIHYVAPTVWAWRPQRAVHMARHIDHVLALFPFEPPLMQKAGMSCDFVGHPVVDDPVPTSAEVKLFRKQYSIGENETLLTVLPGSRLMEINRMSPVFQDVLRRVAAQRPKIRYVVPVTRNVEAKFLASISDWPGKPIILLHSAEAPEKAEHQKRLAFAASDLALAASGTVSLELAAAGTPMVIAYDTNRLTGWLLRRKSLIDTATLVNIVSGTRHVPEFLFEDFAAEPIADCLLRLLDSPSLSAPQIEAAKKTMEMLGQGDDAPGLRAARSVMKFIAL